MWTEQRDSSNFDGMVYPRQRKFRQITNYTITQLRRNHEYLTYLSEFEIEILDEFSNNQKLHMIFLNTGNGQANAAFTQFYYIYWIMIL